MWEKQCSVPWLYLNSWFTVNNESFVNQYHLLSVVDSKFKELYNYANVLLELCIFYNIKFLLELCLFYYVYFFVELCIFYNVYFYVELCIFYYAYFLLELCVFYNVYFLLELCIIYYVYFLLELCIFYYVYFLLELCIFCYIYFLLELCLLLLLLLSKSADILKDKPHAHKSFKNILNKSYLEQFSWQSLNISSLLSYTPLIHNL